MGETEKSSIITEIATLLERSSIYILDPTISGIYNIFNMSEYST